MALFDIQEFTPDLPCTENEPDGCEICGHCRLLREVLLEGRWRPSHAAEELPPRLPVLQTEN